jgi:hypothetical protein
MFILFKHGQHYLSDSPQGPWTARPILESRQNEEDEVRAACQLVEDLFEVGPMNESAFERRLREESEQRRRRLREAETDVPFDLDDGELDALLAEVKRFAQEGKGEAGQPVTRREVIDFFARQLDEAHAEPTEADEALEGAFGVQARGRRRLQRGELSNEEFLKRLHAEPTYDFGYDPMSGPY